MNKELKDRIESLGWFIGKRPTQYFWQLSNFSPAGLSICISVLNVNFLDEIRDYAENFDLDAYVEVGKDDSRIFLNRALTYEELVRDGQAAKEMLVELYNSNKDLEVFNGNTGRESQEEAD